MESLPPLSEIFIDANIFLYQIFEHPKFFPSCNDFLKRIELNVHKGITSTLVLNEVIHKSCLAEAAKVYKLRSERDAARLLKERPEVLLNLSRVWRSYADIEDCSLTIYSIDEATMDKAVDISHRYVSQIRKINFDWVSASPLSQAVACGVPAGRHTASLL